MDKPAGRELVEISIGRTLKKTWSLVSNQSWKRAASSFSWSWEEPREENKRHTLSSTTNNYTTTATQQMLGYPTLILLL